MSGSSTPRRLSAAQYALASKKDVHHGIKSFRSCDYRPYISCAGRKPTVRIYGSDIRRDRWIVVWIDTGVISGALIFIKKTFGLSTFEQGLAVSSVLVGAAVTAITGGSLSDRFGRRKMLLITSVIFMAVCGGMLRGRIHPGPCCWTSNFRSGNWARELRCSSFHRLKHAVGRYPSSN